MAAFSLDVHTPSKTKIRETGKHVLHYMTLYFTAVFQSFTSLLPPGKTQIVLSTQIDQTFFVCWINYQFKSDVSGGGGWRGLDWDLELDLELLEGKTGGVRQAEQYWAASRPPSPPYNLTVPLPFSALPSFHTMNLQVWTFRYENPSINPQVWSYKYELPSMYIQVRTPEY